MSKMHYFSNKVLKIANARGSPPQMPLNVQYWWPEVPWFGQIVLFRAYDEIKTSKKLWRHFSNVITIKSPKNVTKIKSQFFSNLGPLNENSWLRQWQYVMM